MAALIVNGPASVGVAAEGDPEPVPVAASSEAVTESPADAVSSPAEEPSGSAEVSDEAVLGDPVEDTAEPESDQPASDPGTESAAADADDAVIGEPLEDTDDSSAPSEDVAGPSDDAVIDEPAESTDEPAESTGESAADGSGSDDPVIGEPLEDSADEPPAAGTPGVDERTPIEVYVPGIRIVPGDGSATVYWSDFGSEDTYVVQVEKADGTWESLATDVEPALSAESEGPAVADNMATVDGLTDGRTYTARIVAAESLAAAEAATQDAVDLGGRGMSAIARVPAADEISTLAATPPFTIRPYIQSTGNPTLVAKCGLDFGLVLDSSGSIGDSGMANLKLAANAFVDALVDTGSSVSVTSFSTASPGSGGVNRAPTALTSANLASIKASYNNLRSNGYTNWEDGLQKSLDRFTFPGAPDLVIFITDGNPNTVGVSPPVPNGGNASPDGSTTAVNPAILLANQMKGQSAHMFGIAVGSSITLNPIRAITSDVPLAADGSNFGSAGYTTTTDYAALANTLKKIAVELCAPSLTITKLVKSAATGPDFVPADGWVFDTEVTIPQGAGTWVNPGTDPIAQNSPSTKSQTTSSSGAANFQWEPNGNLTSTVRVRETLKEGYQRVATMECTIRNVLEGTQRTVSVTVDGSGFWSIGDIYPREIATCTVRNTLTTLTLIKTVTNDNGGSAQPSAWTLTATGRTTGISGTTGSAPVTNRVVLPGTYALSESGGPAGYTPGPWSCVGGSQTGGSVTLTPGQGAVCTINNNDKPAHLTLVKAVSPQGAANPTAWTLRAQGPTTISGSTGTPAVTNATVSAGAYTLSESGGPAGFTPQPWSCVGGALNGSILTLGLGQSATCTITNTRNQHLLTLQKTWVNGLQDDRAYLGILGGSGGTPIRLSKSTGQAGAWTDPATATRNVMPGSPVAVTEVLGIGNEGSYERTLTCTGGVTPNALGLFTMPDSEVTCTFTNSRLSRTVTLQKTWVNGLLDDTAALSVTGGTAISPNRTSTSNGQAGSWTDPGTVQRSVLPGAAVTVAEVLSGQGAYESILECVAGDDEFQTTGAFEMPDESVVCTYTNTRLEREVILQKEWVNGLEGDTAELSIEGGTAGEGQTNPSTSTATGADGIDTENQAASTVLVGDEVTVSEAFGAGNGGAYGSELTCSIIEGEDVTTEDGTFTMPDAPVVCTFTNTRVQHEVKLQKAWVDARAGDTAALTITGGLEGNTRTSTATGGLGTIVDTTNVASTPVLVGDTVKVSEVLGSANLGKYSATLACTAGDATIEVGADGTFRMPNADVTCTFTNARTVVGPPQPTVTAEICDPNIPGAQLPGSITIPANADYAYYIDGVATAAGTYPKPAGTYVVTAQLLTSGPVARSSLSQLAVQPTYTWTIVVAGSPVCPVLDKTSTPPSGDTVVTGDIVNYQIVVSNGGDTAVVGETLVDTLPTGAELVAGSNTPSNGVYNAAARTITWTFDLAAAAGGAPATATFAYQVEVTADDGTLVNNVSWVQRNLTDSTTHPVEPGEIGGEEDTDEGEDEEVVDDTEDLASTGAGNEASLALAGLVIMVLGGGMVLFDRRRRRS